MADAMSFLVTCLRDRAPAHNFDKGGHLRRRGRFEEISKARIEAAAASCPPYCHIWVIEIQHQDMLAPGDPGLVIDETTFVPRMNVLEVLKNGEDKTEVEVVRESRLRPARPPPHITALNCRVSLVTCLFVFGRELRLEGRSSRCRFHISNSHRRVSPRLRRICRDH
jgi:hypothetical protein